MSTFSEIVDEVAQTAGLKTNLPQAANYVNRAMKLLTPIFHHSDLVEWQVPISRSDNKHIFELPLNHRTTRTVQLDNTFYAKRKPPGLVQAIKSDGKYFYYESGTKLVISGRVHRLINIAYYRVTPKLKYYPVEYRLLRSSLHELDGEYQYRAPETNDWYQVNTLADHHAKALERHTNWLTRGYSEVLTNGALSHAYNSKGETERGTRLFQIFANDVKMMKKAHEELTIGQQ